MRIENVVGTFLEDAFQRGAETAIAHLRRKIPFCTDLHDLADELQRKGEEVMRMRRGCMTIIGIMLSAMLVAIPVVMASSLPAALRLFSCFVASTAAVTAYHMARAAVILTPEPFETAAAFVRGCTGENMAEIIPEIGLQPAPQS